MQTPGDPRNTYLTSLEWTADSQRAADPAVEPPAEHQRSAGGRRAHRRGAPGAPRAVAAPGSSASTTWCRSTSGRAVIWTSEKDGWRHLYRVALDGSGDQLLTHVRGRRHRRRVGRRGRRLGVSDRLARHRRPSATSIARGSTAAAASSASRRPARTARTPTGSRPTDAGRSTRFRAPTCRRASSSSACPITRWSATLADNAALAAKAAPLLTPPTEFFTVDVGDGVVLDGSMIKPPAFDPAKRYPVLVYVYGEPASQTVVDRWGGSRACSIARSPTTATSCLSFDNRGTPAPKGTAWRKVVYGTVGDLSSKEQAAAVRAFAASHPFVDRDRVGVWGWSGGGSNTLNAMFRFPDVFKVGISVAPVPDQRLYDTIYQERYMGLPQDNADGYRVGSPINFAEGLKGKLLDRPRLRRRQRALPGHRAPGQPPRRAQQAVRPDGVSRTARTRSRKGRAPACTCTR